MHVWCLFRVEQGIRCHRTRVREDCELPCGCLKLNPYYLEQQSVLLTTESFIALNQKYFSHGVLLSFLSAEGCQRCWENSQGLANLLSPNIIASHSVSLCLQVHLLAGI